MSAWKTRVRGTPRQIGTKFRLQTKTSKTKLPTKLKVARLPCEPLTKYKILEVDEIKFNGTEYLGENYYAAKELGHPFPYPKNVILIKKGLSPEEKRKTVLHELVEIALMKRGMKFKDAHRIAYRTEKFPELKSFGTIQPER